jgi:hypothetical protein
MPLGFFDFLKSVVGIPDTIDRTTQTYGSVASSSRLKKVALATGAVAILYLAFTHIDTVLHVFLRYKEFQDKHDLRPEQKNWLLQWLFAPGAGIGAFCLAAGFSNAWKDEGEYAPIGMGFVALVALAILSFATNYLGDFTFLSLDFFYWFRLFGYVVTAAGFLGLIVGLGWPTE